MAFMNTAPKAVAPATAGATPPVKPANAPAAPSDKARAKKKPVRDNIGRILREKL